MLLLIYVIIMFYGALLLFCKSGKSVKFPPILIWLWVLRYDVSPLSFIVYINQVFITFLPKNEK
jgi:hypothetical protein